MSKIKGMAHRGDSLKYPENTMLAFEAAMSIGFSHLEIDVQLSLDGVPVVIHDISVDRTSNGSGAVGTMTLDQLKQLDMGSGQRIPTLAEVLDLVGNRMMINLELKQMGDLYPGLEKKVADAVHNANMLNQVIVTSFDHYAVERIREFTPKLRTGLISYGASPCLPSYAKNNGDEAIAINYRYITDKFLKDCLLQGIQVVAWTVDEIADMRRLVIHYPDVLICTNNLEGLVEVHEEEI